MNNTRTDEHRPSQINPDEYQFVAYEVVRGAFQGDLGACMYMQHQREIIQGHMAQTGGTYSAHAHGGNCMVCGNVNAIYTILFYHAKSNTYVRMGEDCAYKVSCSHGDMNAFRAAVKNALAAVAGKKKAHAFLVAEDLERAWELYTVGCERINDPVGGYSRWSDAAQEARKAWKYEETTLVDMVEKLVKYGSLSEKQVGFMKTLVARMPERERIARERAAEAAVAADCPEGRVVVHGVVLSTKVVDGVYGAQVKMLVKDTTGFKVWCTVPDAWLGNTPVRGATVRFKATVKPSTDDKKFGFGSRPHPIAIEYKAEAQTQPEENRLPSFVEPEERAEV